MLTRCLKQPEANPELYNFVNDAFVHLDEASDTETANFPLFFALHLPHFFGFRIQDNYSEERHYLDLQEGSFVSGLPYHSPYLEDREAFITSQFLKVQQPAELSQLKLHGELRSRLLQAYEKYYSLHIQDFGLMRTLPVLREIIS